MPSTNNLAQYFAQQQQKSSSNDSNSVPRPSINIPRSSKSPSPSPSSYSVHSKAVDAEDDDHFEKSTFQLKRTRSVGLLDEFIAPTRKLMEADQQVDGNETEEEEEEEDIEDDGKYDIDYDDNNNNNNTSRNFNDNNNDDDDDENQFIEDVDDESFKSKPKNKKSPVYSYDDDYSYSSFDNEDENASMSPSPPETPDLYQPHDDNDIVYEPQRHVDYLSHNWKESDIQKSWRYIVLKRKDVANSARLENASWRTWAQAKYHLKTISPESVNWLKDSDVTWLYGPLYKEPKNFQALDGTSSSNATDKKYGSDSESAPITKKSIKQVPGSQPRIKGPKPILKKRTVSEMLSQPSLIKLPPHRHRGQSPIIESGHSLPSPPSIEDDFDVISSRVNAQYKKHPHHEELNQQQPHHDQQKNLLASASSLDSIPKRHDDSKEQIASSSATPQLQPQQPPKRHIHFNDRVEQCMAVNYPDSGEDEEYDEDYEGDEELNESDSEDEEGGFFLQVRAPSTPQIHNKDLVLPLSLNEAKNLTQGEHPPRFQTIEILPCTTLKHGSDEEDEEDDNDDKYAVSHNVNTSRGFNYYYDYNSVYPSDQNIPHVHLGNNEYELDASAQHLEGVKLVDVPENIILGSNVEIEDTPKFAEPETTESIEQSTILQKPENKSNTSGAFVLHSDEEGDSSSEEDEEHDNDQQSMNPNTSSSSSSGGSKNFGENIGKISSSPSYASLSDVAAQGYISQSPNSNNLSNVISKNYNNANNNIKSNEPVINHNNNNSNSNDDNKIPSNAITSEYGNDDNDNNNFNKSDVNEVQKESGSASPSEEKTGFKHTFLNSWKRGN